MAPNNVWETPEKLLCPLPCRRSDDAVLARRAEIVAALKRIVPGEGVIAFRGGDAALRERWADRLSRSCPWWWCCRKRPSRWQRCSVIATAKASRWCRAAPAPRCRAARCRSATACFSAWPSSSASATSISTIASPVVEPGVTNLAVSQAVEHAGFYYAPDPSSQIACTIGGNVAENSGGVHCLKYGVTTNNVLGCELVLMTGEILRLGGKHLDAAGYDLLGIVTGSEGLLGVVTEVTVRILKKPESARAALIGFAASEDGGECVARIIGAGIIPGRHGDDGPSRHPCRRGRSSMPAIRSTSRRC